MKEATTGTYLHPLHHVSVVKQVSVMAVFILLYLILCNFILLSQQTVLSVHHVVTVEQDYAVSMTNDKFISVALDTGTFINHWEAFDPRAPVGITLAKALYPAYFRVGGTTADSLTFRRDIHELHDTAIPNSTLTATDWDKLNYFTTSSNLSFIFGLNSLYRSDGAAWDPTNAIELMKYSAEKGYILDLELGNEPDIYPQEYNRSVDPQQLGRDFGTLRNLMDTMPSFRSRILVGPDVATGLGPGDIYQENFMKTGSDHIDAMTFHHYYLNSHTARPQDFVDPVRLDSFIPVLKAAQDTLRNFSQGTKKFWVGETSTTYNGGTPGISNTFVAGFMWLDKLGLSAYYGAAVVIRQEFVGGNYGLVDYSDGIFSPNPDYWTTVLFKMLVGETVLSTGQTEEKLRVYSHCTSRRLYGPGAITFYLMNLLNSSIGLSFAQFTGSDLHVYTLTSGDPTTFLTRMVLLNGKLLEMISEQLPPLRPAIQSSTEVVMPAFSYGFIVVPDARAAACM